MRASAIWFALALILFLSIILLSSSLYFSDLEKKLLWLSFFSIISILTVYVINSVFR